MLSCGVLLLWTQGACAVRSSLPVASEGVLDLRAWDFASDGAVQLTGDWGFCWDALLEPGDPPPDAGACGTMHVPGLWTDRGAAPGRGVASYRLRILLPRERPPLSLRVGAPLTAHRLFIDGRWYPGSGRVTRTPEHYRSQLWNRIHVLPDSGNELRLLVQVENFDFRSGGLRRRWILGSREDVRNWATAVTLRDATLATVYLLVGLFFLGFFVNRPQEQTRLYFGLAGVALGLRVIPGNYSDLSQLVAPTWTFSTTLRLEYLANNFMVFVGIGYFAHKVPRDMPAPIVRLVQVGALAGMLAALALPLAHSQIPMRSAYVLGAGMLASSLWALARAARRGEPNVRITLAAVTLCLAVVLWDSVRAEGAAGSAVGLAPNSMFLMVFTEALALFPTTLLAFVLTEAVVLMRAFSRSYRTIETLSKDLIVSNEELRDMNRAVVRFVPFDFLRLLDKKSIRDVQRGDCLEMEMGILFCDIRSFTSRAESLTPDEAFRFVNAFTGWMEAPIHEHGGFINEYLGDCILALFPDGSDAAVGAGLGMQVALDGFNRAEREATRSFEPVRIGIGVNTGSLMLGTIGGSVRLAHTVIGDSVNVASRVESLTKLYGATFLISGSTRDGLPDDAAYQLRLLDQVVLRGRSEPIPIWEVLDALDPGTRERKLTIREAFEEARVAYQNGSFAQAERLFADCRARAPDDLACEIYIDRCRKLAVEGVPPGWQGESSTAET